MTYVLQLSFFAPFADEPVRGGVEVVLLLRSEMKAEAFVFGEGAVEVLESGPETVEIVVEGAVDGVVEYIVPYYFGVEAVEGEAA